MRELTYAIAELRDVQGTINHHVGTDFTSIPTNTLVTLKDLHARLQVIINNLVFTNDTLEKIKAGNMQ